MTYIYLASPYSAPTFGERVNRFMAAQKASIFLLREYMPVYSPIVHWHHIVQMEELPFDYASFKVQNDAFIRRADKFVVLITPGWKESVGVYNELQLARSLDLRCFTMVPVGSRYELVEMDFKSWTPDSVIAQ